MNEPEQEITTFQDLVDDLMRIAGTEQGLTVESTADLLLMVKAYVTVSTENEGSPADKLRVTNEALGMFMDLMLETSMEQQPAFGAMVKNNPEVGKHWSVAMLVGMVLGQELTVQRHA